MEIAEQVWQELRRDETGVGVIVQPASDHSIGPDELEQVIGSLLTEFAEHRDEIDQMARLEMQETTRGPAIVLTDLDPNDAAQVFERLGERLARHGLGDARLVPMPTVRPDKGRGRGFRFIKAWFGIRGTRPDGWTGVLGWPANQPTWRITDEDKAAAVDDLVGWVSSAASGTATAAVSTGSRFVPVPLASVSGFVHRAVRKPSQTSFCQVFVMSGDHFRSVDLVPGLGVVAGCVGASNPEAFQWQSDLAAARLLLEQAGDWCSGAHLTRAHGSGRVTALDADNGDRFIGNPWLSRHHELSAWIGDGQLVDVHGVMRLNPSLASRLSTANESAFAQHRLSERAALVIHTDLEAWFGRSTIATEVLSPARIAAGSALLDRSNERLDEEPT